VDQCSPNFFHLTQEESWYKIYLSNFKYLFRSGDIRCRTLKSSKIGSNFACFWPLKFVSKISQKFWTSIIKSNLVLITVQNNLRMKCSALNVDFSSPSPNPTFKEAGASGRERRLPPKKWLFYRNCLA